MRLFYLILLFYLFVACNNVNRQAGEFIRDSIIASNSTDTSILIYTEGLEKIKDALDIKESCVYTSGDYSFYFVKAEKDSVPVFYKEIGDNGEYGFNYKTYYLQDNNLVLFTEKSKVKNAGANKSYEYKETRTFFRNGVFLKEEQRIAESDSLLNETPFTKLDENIGNKNPQYDFQRIQNAVAEIGEFDLRFDRLQVLGPSKTYLIMHNNERNLESSYLIKKPDSLIIKIKEQPETFKDKSLKIDYKKEGMLMIYNGGKLRK